MKTVMNESLCPFCNQENKCMLASADSCWCMRVEVPKALQDLVPEDKKLKACICQDCVRAFCAEPDEFRNKVKAGDKS